MTSPVKKAGRPPKTDPIPTSEYKGIVEHMENSIFHYTCPYPVVLHSWLQTIMAKPMKPTSVKVVALKDRLVFVAVKEIPVSKHGISEHQEKKSIISIDCANSYEYYCAEREYVVSFNVSTLMQSLKTGVKNTTLKLQFGVKKSESEKFYVKTIQKSGPNALDKIHCELMEYHGDLNLEPNLELGNGFLEFRNVNNEDFKKMFNSKQFADGSNLSNMFIEKDHRIELQMPTPDKLGSSYEWEKESLGENNGILYHGPMLKKAKVPHKDIGTFCSKDTKNPVTFILSDNDCRMFRTKNEMLFYHSLPLIEDHIAIKKK